MSLERYSYNSNQPLNFLQEISEHYANAQFFGSDPDIILVYAEKTLGEIPNIQFYINKQLFYKDIQNEIQAYLDKTKNDKYRLSDPYPKEDDGDNEFISTFKWRCTNDVELMKKWFCLLYKLGGDPSIKNVQGKTAFDVCRERMLEEGYRESEVSDFLRSL